MINISFQFFKNLYAVLTDKSAFVYAVNAHMKSKNIKFVDTSNITGCLINNSFILPLDQCDCVLKQVFSDYDFSDLRATDTVLDIGANVGIFSLAVCDKVKKVYAVEPLYTEELKVNIKSNNKNNISILPYALSDQKTLSVSFDKKTGTAQGKTFSEILNICGRKIDFLKCDCEGGEWCISPDDLTGIRRIEMEIHSFNNECLQDYTKMLRTAGYCIKTQKVSSKIILVHGYRRK